jgi:amino acid transporter
MIYRIVYRLRIIAVCLIVFFALDYLFQWKISQEILVVVPFFLLAYVIASMIMIFVRFRQQYRRPPKTFPDKTMSQETEKHDE